MAASTAAVHAVALKLPPFWADEPDIWFAQAESQFTLRSIVAEDTKFHYVVAALDGQTARRVGDLLRTPPTNPYTTLKKRLLSTFALSERERAAQLLDLEELGDRKPSALVDHILALAGDGNRDFLLREIFLRKLPEPIRAIVASSTMKDLRKLGSEADKHFSTSGAMFSTAASCEVIQQPSTEIQASLRPRRPQMSSRPVSSSKTLCFYHEKFGNAARKCRAPCTWGNETADNRQ